MSPNRHLWTWFSRLGFLVGQRIDPLSSEEAKDP